MPLTTLWRGDAPAVAQVTRVIPANVEVGDVFTLSINGKSITATATAASVASAVAAIVAAWNASTIPEFAEITASAGSGYVVLTADTPGVPFDVAVSAADGGGFTVVVTTTTQGSAARNEIQRVSLPAGVGGGAFTLTFAGQTTGALDYDFTAAEIETALEALSNIASGDVAVTGDAGGPWTIEFLQAYATTNVPLLVGNGANLTSAASLSVTTITDGSANATEVQELEINASVLQTGDQFSISGNLPGGSFPTVWFSGRTVDYPDTDELQEGFDDALGAGVVTASSSIDEEGVVTITLEFSGYAGQDVALWSLTYYDGFPSGGGLASFTEIVAGGGTGANEVQRITLVGATAGTYTATFQGQTTAGIAFDAADTAVKSALEALSNVDLVTVVKQVAGNTTTWTITFGGVNAALDLLEMTVDGSGLTGGTVTVATTQTAAAAVNEVQVVSFSQTPSGGAFTLTVEAETTGNLDFDSTSAEIDTAIEGLTSRSAGDVAVTGPAGGPWVLTFGNTLAATDVATSGDGTDLTGGGAETVTVSETTRSEGPNHADTPRNWTANEVPNSLDTPLLADGAVDMLYGLRWRVAATYDATSDVWTLASKADFRVGQILRARTDDTLPAGYAANTDYHVIAYDRDTLALQLSATSGGSAVDGSDAGTGTHTLAVELTAPEVKARYRGDVGLPNRNPAGYYEYRPTDWEIGLADSSAAVPILIGAGPGSGSRRVQLDPAQYAAALEVRTSGSGADDVPAVLFRSTNGTATTITLLDGELGLHARAGESGTVASITQRGGTLRMDNTAVTAELTRTGGTLTGEGNVVTGALTLY